MCVALLLCVLIAGCSNSDSADRGFTDFEHIEDDPYICLLCMQEGCHRLDCDFRRWFMGKVKFPGGYAAKSNALAVVFHGQNRESVFQITGLQYTSHFFLFFLVNALNILRRADR